MEDTELSNSIRRGCLKKDRPFKERIKELASLFKNRKQAAIELIVEQDKEMARHCCPAAVIADSSEGLKWARSLDPPLPWDETVSYMAIVGGRSDMLAWMLSQKPPCPWSKCCHSCGRMCRQRGPQYLAKLWPGELLLYGGSIGSVEGSRVGLVACSHLAVGCYGVWACSSSWTLACCAGRERRALPV